MRYWVFIPLTVSCMGTLACAAKTARIAPAAVAAPQPAQPAIPAAAEPISIPQTNVVLPDPQPIQAAALAVASPQLQRAPELPPQTLKQRMPVPPRIEARPPAGQTPPAPPAGSRRRIRPVESAAERRRLLNEIGARERYVQQLLAKARTRPLSDSERAAADRIQVFLQQTDAAVKDKDLEQAQALSNRALVLCQELNSNK